MNDTIDPAAASGRFLLRIEPALHSALREAARAAGVSLNDYCTRKLAAPGVNVAGPETDAVLEAAAILGDRLVGVAVFGSWARGDETARSDVDLLVVAQSSVPITRELYTSWDRRELAWEGHSVEPHFVRLIDPRAEVSGLWAEVAVDGIVLFERGLALSKCLVQVRRRIVQGDLVRRLAHGQAYWVDAA